MPWHGIPPLWSTTAGMYLKEPAIQLSSSNGLNTVCRSLLRFMHGVRMTQILTLQSLQARRSQRTPSGHICSGTAPPGDEPWPSAWWQELCEQTQQGGSFRRVQHMEGRRVAHSNSYPTEERGRHGEGKPAFLLPYNHICKPP